MSRLVLKLRKNLLHLPGRFIDFLQGLDFGGFLASDSSENFSYEKTDEKILVKAFNEISLGAEDALIDLGCGKGFVLKVAARQFGVLHPAGVELRKSLFATCSSNMKRLGIQARLHCCDAGTFEGFDDYNVIYMFNPFGKEVMRSVLQHLKTSIMRKPRQVRVLYANPVLHDCLMEVSDSFSVVEGFIAGHKSCIAIYQIKY